MTFEREEGFCCCCCKCYLAMGDVCSDYSTGRRGMFDPKIWIDGVLQ